jgi:hypothetical protein
MGSVVVTPPVEYIVTEDGQRTAVVMRWEDYQALQAMLPSDPEALAGLSEAELQALAEGMLSPAHQEHLADLLQRNRETGLSEEERRELDRLLDQVDQMNVLKARALYSLERLDLAGRGSR